MKCNVTVKAIASAEGWLALYGSRDYVRLVCWALTDDGIVGLILGPGGDVRNAEGEVRGGANFDSYQREKAEPH